MTEPFSISASLPAKAILARWLRRCAMAAGIVAAAVGAGHLVAWLNGYLAAGGFNDLVMKTNAALCLLLAGTSLAILAADRPPGWLLWAARVMAGLVAAIGLATLTENLTGGNLGIDELLAHEPPGEVGVTGPNRMGSPAALSFALAGLSLLTLSRPGRRGRVLSQCLALGVCALAMVGAIGYLYGATGLYALVRLTAIAWPTAVALLALGLGLLLARPAEGLMAQVTADDPGGASLRRWMPVLLMPVALGWLRLFGERHHWFDAATGTAIMMIIFIFALSVLAYVGARPVSRSSAVLKNARAESDTAAEFLKLINRSTSTRELVAAVVSFFHQQSGCQAVGVRLKDGDDYPYYEAHGFPEQFVLLENSLCERDPQGNIQRDNVGNPCIACMCGNVICGRFDPAKPFFSPNGSFWSNCTTELLASTTEADRKARTRNRCNGQGYESVALIPLRLGGDRLGLLQLNDHRKGMFTAETIALWERLASYLAVALAKLRAEDGLRLSEEKFALAFASNAAAIAITRLEDGRFVDVNDTWVALNGYSRDEAIGASARTLGVWPSAEAAGKFVEELNAKGALRGWEQEFMRKSGEVYVARLSATVLTFQNQKLILSTLVDITDRKRAEEALRGTVAELERSNRELEQFAYISTHDLQEPLRQVRAYVGLLQDRHADKLDGKAAQYMTYVREGAARMSDLVQGLLDYSRVGADQDHRQPVSCVQALETALADLQVAIGEASARVTHDVLPTIAADPAQLALLFQNLVANAIKFRRDGVPPEVHVGCKRDEGQWQFSVTDNGIGIPPEYRDQVFLIFQRLHTREKYPGTGIGLAICKKIVERRGGRIWVESNEGAGSTFKFSIPDGGGR